MNKKLIHYIITALLIFGFGFLPPFDPITPFGMKILGSFLGVIYGWTAIGMIWPSLMALISVGLTIGMPKLLSISFGDTVVTMLIMLFILIALLNELHITEIIANYFVTNRLVQGRPWTLIFLFFLGVYVCTIIHPFVSIVLFASFLKSLCKQLDIKPHTALPTSMMIGFAYVAMLGQIMFPFLSTGILLSSSFEAMNNGKPFSYLSYIMYMIPMSIVLILFFVLIMRFILRIDVSSLKNVTSDMIGEKKKMTRDQRIAFFGFLITIICIPLGSILPKSWPITQFLSQLSMFGIVTLAVCILMIFVNKEKKSLLDFSKMASSGLLWDVILMLAYIMPISNLLSSEETGITAFLKQILAPLMSLSPIVFILLTLIFSVVVTNFANNAVIVIVLMPVVIAFSNQIGLNPACLMVVLFLATQLALATPGGSPMTGLCFAYNDLVTPSMMMKYSLKFIPLMFLVTLLIGLPYALLIF